MDKPISVGDLVMVVRPVNCGHSCGVGRAFIVRVITDCFSYQCGECSRGGGYSVGVEDEAKNWYSIGRVKRIDPPALPENVDEREELTA